MQLVGPVAVSYATSAVECFVALASYGTQSQWHTKKLENRSSNRRLFFLSFPGEPFSQRSVSLARGHFFGGIFSASPRMPPQSRSFRASCPEYLGRGDSEAGRSVRAACDSTRARTTPHTHRRRCHGRGSVALAELGEIEARRGRAGVSDVVSGYGTTRRDWKAVFRRCARVRQYSRLSGLSIAARSRPRRRRANAARGGVFARRAGRVGASHSRARIRRASWGFPRPKPPRCARSRLPETRRDGEFFTEALAAFPGTRTPRRSRRRARRVRAHRRRNARGAASADSRATRFGEKLSLGPSRRSADRRFRRPTARLTDLLPLVARFFPTDGSATKKCAANRNALATLHARFGREVRARALDGFPATRSRYLIGSAGRVLARSKPRKEPRSTRRGPLPTRFDPAISVSDKLSDVPTPWQTRTARMLLGHENQRGGG